MKKKLTLLSFLYYVLIPLAYAALFAIASLLVKSSGASGNLGAVMAATYALMFLAVPVLTVILMRFSLLRWYVDPIAAAEIPLFLYGMMIISRIKRAETFSAAFLAVNESLCRDGGEGLFFLIGLFVFGLLSSFSLARKEGQSISYQLLGKVSSQKRSA